MEQFLGQRFFLMMKMLEEIEMGGDPRRVATAGEAGGEDAFSRSASASFSRTMRDWLG